MLSILYGLGAALGWGAADFTGGLASRKTNPYRAVLYSEIIGIALLILAVTIIREPLPGLRSWMLAMLAGAVGTFGLMLLYRAMATGLMSVAAPVSALLAAALPIVVGMFTQGLPKGTTILGFAFALFAVWMISQSKEGGVTDVIAHLSDLKLPLLAGIGFGSYFVIMHEAVKNGATFVPMIASRSGGLVFITVYMLAAHISWKVEDKSAWGLIALNGALDVCGNAFFVIASQIGRLDVASVLSSLFPAATVALAWIVLKERLSRNQWIGVAAALFAIVLMTI